MNIAFTIYFIYTNDHKAKLIRTKHAKETLSPLYYEEVNTNSC